MATYDFGNTGYDIEFRLPSMSTGNTIYVGSDIGLVDGETASFISIEYTNPGWTFSVLDSSKGAIYEFERSFDDTPQDIRIVLHDVFFSIYVDEVWVTTFFTDYILYPDGGEASVALSASTNLTITNLRKKELSDWREAAYIDMETVAWAAVMSIILQRPVDTFPRYDGSVSFVYDKAKDIISVIKPGSGSINVSDTSMACSDGIVYASRAAVRVDSKFARDIGWVTRFISLPDLDSGAIKAASLIQKKERQRRRYLKGLTTRLDPAMEIDDIADLDFTLSSTAKSIVEEVIVESILYDVSQASQSMSISGRINDE